jgi:hypothetical protein
MAENNNAVTKEDLRNALDEVVTYLSKQIQESAATTEVNITAEMNKRFRRAGRQRQAFHKKFENQIHEIRGEVISGFENAKAHAEKITNEHCK